MTEYLDFTTLVRPKSPNTYLSLPAGYPSSAEPDMTSPEFEVPAAQLFDALTQVVSEAGARGSLQADIANRRLKYVATTSILRFKDDVDVAVVETDASSSSLAVYSRSRIGYSDLGANRKRVEKLLNAVRAHIRA